MASPKKKNAWLDQEEIDEASGHHLRDGLDDEDAMENLRQTELDHSAEYG